MKGSLFLSVRSLVLERFGQTVWAQALERAGIPVNSMFMAIGDVDDNLFEKVVRAVSEITGADMPEMWDAVADHWVGNYTQQAYPFHYQGVRSAKEFLLHMDHVHTVVTKATAKAKPPRFEYSQPDAQTLTIRYVSGRGLTDYFSALVAAVGRHFNENIRIDRPREDTIRLVFDS